jgi:ABC-type transporter Mla MlaB component
MARRSVEFRGPGSGLDFHIRQLGVTVWVTLFGTLDRSQLSRLKLRLTPALKDCGHRVVLDGRSLAHVDYRAVQPLIHWHRHLCAFNHQLYLYQWNDYLKAILCVEDWERELNPTPVRPSPWRTLAHVRQGTRI